MSVLLRAIGYVALTILFAWLARRLLGANRVSWLRAILAGIAGCVVGASIGWALTEVGVDDDTSAVGVALVTALLVTMGLIVALQLISRPRVGPRPVGGIVGSVKVAVRTGQVLRIAARHGLGPYVGRRRRSDQEPNASQLRSALEESGVVFVKFGQVLAGRPDLVGASMAAELGDLRHRVTPLGREAMEAALRAGIDDADALIETIDWEPLGSASIAQVYAARLRDGSDVVIKIRRPGIEAEVRRDALVVRHLSQVVERHSQWARSIGIADLADSFVADLERELDYGNEARAADELAQAFAETEIGVPAVHADVSSDSVLVMQRIVGATLAEADLSGVAGDVRAHRAASLVSAHVGAMLDGGRYHADAHPGNVMLTPSGELRLIDFGATGVLDASEQAGLASMLLGLRLREPTMLRDSVLEVSEPEGPVDTARLDRALAHLMAEHIRPDENVGPDAVLALLAIMRDANLRLPASSSSMFRGLLTVLDSVERLSPGFAVLDGIDEVSDVKSPVPTNPQEFADLARDETYKLLPLLRRAPRLTDSIATQLDRGDLSVRVRGFSHPDDVRLVTSLVNRAVLAFVAVGLGIVSAMLFALEKGPFLTPNLSVYDVLASIGLLAGAVLIMRVVLEALDSDTR